MTTDAQAKAKAYRLVILARDPDYFRRASRAHRERNPNYHHDWCHANPGRAWAIRARAAAKRAGRLPPWSDLESVLPIYELAQEFRDVGVPVHVDHIVPLKHPLVCGLHVVANLRPSTIEGNTKKGNTFPSYFHADEQQSLSRSQG